MATNDAFESWLSQQLREAEDYLDDNGFTDQLMSRLPAQPLLQKSKPLRWPTLLAGALSSLLVAWFFPVGYVVESVLFANISLFTLAAAGAALSTLTCAVAIFANQRV